METEKTILEKLQKENTDLKELYIRIAKHLDKKGHFELSEYMLAQIEATPTFTTWEEYTTWISKEKIRERINKVDKMLELTTKNQLQPYTPGELIFIKGILKELLESEEQ